MMAFGTWLVGQDKKRPDWIGALAQGAARDAGFPSAGTPDEVRAHLSKRGADPDQFEMLDDAEAEWLRAD